MAAIALTVCVWFPASAHATLAWSSTAGGPQTLSPMGDTASDVQVATDAAGDAIAVWVQSDANNGAVDRVAEAYRPAGGNFDNWTFISDTEGNAESVKVAINTSGQAIVIWNEAEGFASQLNGEYAMSYPNGTFSPPASSASDTDGQPNGGLNDAEVGIDAAGDALIAYACDNVCAPYANGSVVALFRPAGANSSFGAGEELNSNSDTNSENPVAPVALSIAMNGAGAAVATWNQQTANPSESDPNNEEVYSAYRAAGASTTENDPAGFSPQDDGAISNTNLTSLSTGPPVAAIDANGDALVVYDETTTSDSDVLDVETAYRSGSAPYPGYFSASTQVGSYTAGGEPDTTFDGVGGPAAAFDGSGNAFVMWGGASIGPFMNNTSPYSPQYQADPLSIAYMPAGGTFGSPVQVAGGNVQGAQLGVDSQGRQAIQWESADTTGTGPVEAVSRDASSGAFTTPVTVTPVADGESGSPQLSMSAGGQAVGVWQFNDGEGEDLAQADFGTQPAAATGPTKPPAAPPEAGAPAAPTVSAQPAPPPPPAAVPTLISAAAPFQRGHAIVLTANVASNVTQVHWSFQGFPDATGTVVNGQLENSVRLHPTGRTFTATVTAVSPGGSQTSSRTFELPAQPTDQTTETVQRELQTVPKVVAVGTAQTLEGNNACGQLTLFVGEQQTSGCMRPINAVSDIPSSELGVMQTLASDLHLNPSDPTEMAVATEQVDGYVAPGQLLLDNTWPVQPSAGAGVVTFPGFGVLTSSNAALVVGGLKFGGQASGFSLDLNPASSKILLGSLPKPQLPDIGGFPTVGDWVVDLNNGDATIGAHIQLPSWLGIAGVQDQIPVTFTATPTQLKLSSLTIGPLNADLGPLSVSDLQLSYDASMDTWTGSGMVSLLDGTSLSAEVQIKHGDFYYAKGTLGLPFPGVPLFTGVNMTSLGFSFGLDPTRLTGQATLSVADLVTINGLIVAAFPTTAHPFELTSSEDGTDFPSDLYNQPIDEPTIGASADVGINLPLIGDTTLGQGFLLYEIPDFIAFGGNAGFTIPDVLSVNGSVAGYENFATDTFDLNGSVQACLVSIICGDAAAAVSRGPDDAGGIGGCVGIDLGFGSVHVGGGILWKHPFDPIIWPFDGCKWTRFALRVGLGSHRSPDLTSAAASTRQTIVVRRGAPWPALKLYGNGAAPLVRVTGPGGQSLDSTDTGYAFSRGGTIRILRYHGSAEDFTVVGLENARPGVYTVTTLPGSVPFGTVEAATNPPDANITAKLTGTDERRTLSYDIRNRPGQTVTFVDSNSGTATGSGAAPIGHVNGGGRGTLHFLAPPGNRARTIYAEFSLDGLAAERIAVAHYQPPSPTLAAPRHLKLTRHGTSVTLTWAPVQDATSYEVALTDRLTGDQIHAHTRADHLVLTHVPRTAGGTLTLRAVESRFARASLTTSVSVTRITMPANRFRPLARCKLIKSSTKSKQGSKTKTKPAASQLKCTGGPAAKSTKPKAKPKH